MVAVTAPKPGIERSSRLAAFELRMAGEVVGDRLLDPLDAAGEVRELAADVLGDQGQRAGGKAVLLLGFHSLELVAALDERAQLLARRVELGVRRRLALSAEPRQHGRVEPLVLAP